MVIRINIITTSGFRKEEGIKVIVYEPSADPIIESGNRIETSFTFIFPESKKITELLSDESVLASLLVPNATVGGNPTNRRLAIYEDTRHINNFSLYNPQKINIQ
jgi:hypothetical protein